MYLLLGNRNILAKPALFEFGVSGLKAGGHAKENLFQKDRGPNHPWDHSFFLDRHYVSSKCPPPLQVKQAISS